MFIPKIISSGTQELCPCFDFMWQNKLSFIRPFFKALALWSISQQTSGNWRVHLGQTGSLFISELEYQHYAWHCIHASLWQCCNHSTCNKPAVEELLTKWVLPPSCENPPQNRQEQDCEVDILWAQQFAVWNLLLIHHCRLHHSSFFFLLTPHVPHLLSVPHLLFPQINLPCGAVDYHILYLCLYFIYFALNLSNLKFT